MRVVIFIVIVFIMMMMLLLLLIIVMIMLIIMIVMIMLIIISLRGHSELMDNIQQIELLYLEKKKIEDMQMMNLYITDVTLDDDFDACWKSTIE